MQQLSLYWSTPAFTVDGFSYAGLPIFVQTASMRIEYLPTEFCTYLAVVPGRSRSQKTWKASAYILLPFLRFMISHKLNWKRPTEEHLAHYRNHIANRHLSKSRTARVMTVVCRFYEWCYSRGHITTLPLSYEERPRRNHSMLAHIAPIKLSARAILIPDVPKPRGHPKYFNSTELEKLTSLLGELDRLIYDWALYTGAREFEIAAIRVDQIPPQSVYRSRRTYALSLETTKGDVPGKLYVPTRLLDRTHQYIRFFGRAQVVRDTRARGKDVPTNLFLGRWGTALQPDSIYNNFKEKLKLAKLRGTFHEIRHTFAILTLDALMRLPQHAGTDGMNALLELKLRMRHSSVMTTEKYLRARNFYLTDLYGELWEPDSA